MSHVEEMSGLHRHAVGAALGLSSEIDVMQELLIGGGSAADFIFRFRAGENDADGEFPTRLIEEAVQTLEPSFSLSSSSSSLIALSLLEDEVLTLLSGKGNPRRLLRALRQADRTYGRHRWVTPFFRNAYKTPDATNIVTITFVEELRDLLDVLRQARTTR